MDADDADKVGTGDIHHTPDTAEALTSQEQEALALKEKITNPRPEDPIVEIFILSCRVLLGELSIDLNPHQTEMIKLRAQKILARLKHLKWRSGKSFEQVQGECKDTYGDFFRSYGV